MVLQGFAFGTGSAIAHRAVGAVAGAFSGDSDKAEAAPAAPAAAAAPVAQAARPQSTTCDAFQREFIACLKEVRRGGRGYERLPDEILHVTALPTCLPLRPAFLLGLQNKSDIAACQMWMDNFNQCQADARLA